MNNSQLSLATLPFKALFQRALPSRFLKSSKSAFLKPTVVRFAFHPSSKGFELHDFMATAAKAVCEFHTPNKIFLVGKNVVQRSASSCQLLHHLEEEVIITFQEPLGCSCPAVLSLQEIRIG